MIAFTDLTGLASSAIVLAAVATWLSGMARLGKIQRMLLASVVAIVVLIPLGGLPLAAYLRGVIGDLSIPSLLLLLLGMACALLGWRQSSIPSRAALQVLVVLAATVLYPMALGLGLFDPYRLGYGSSWFLGILLLLSLAAWFWRLYLAALSVALAVLAWSVGWYESANLWDYLLDPLLAVFALSALVRQNMAKEKGLTAKHRLS